MLVYLGLALNGAISVLAALYLATSKAVTARPRLRPPGPMATWRSQERDHTARVDLVFVALLVQLLIIVAIVYGAYRLMRYAVRRELEEWDRRR